MFLQKHLKYFKKCNSKNSRSDFIGNKTADKITKIFRSLPQNSSETDTNETVNIEIVREIPKQRYIFTEKRKQIIDY